ncbi:DUF4293 domain-containing protein [Crocinitomix algicola]|uniref:DUF4293 domain-containing protein n=1 Tax=Crocinitomix algicola TaxID=1740263 RepID=UPI0009F6C86C|nr:DUF4293 domain-containing protein [Crocinitomix algicola]
MIQRIQSIYLLLAFICMTMLLFFPVFSIELSQPDTETIKALLTKDGIVSGQNLVTELPLFYVYILLALLSIACILLYKKRPRQLMITRINLILHVLLVLGIYTFYFFGEPFVMDGLSDGVYENAKIVFLMDTGFFFLIPPVAFIFLAIRGIKRDENLVNSLNRLR